MSQQSCRWCFTINNPVSADDEALEKLAASEQRLYLVVGNEVGAEGTPHKQGYVVFSRAWRFKRLQKFFNGRAHLEVARGSSLQASNYCKKDGDFLEFGECPKDARFNRASEEARWKAAYEAAKRGAFEEIPVNMYIRYKAAFESVFDDHCHATQCIDSLDHLWIVGPTGSGKSRYCFDTFPGAYRKGANKWWCHYTNQDDVIIEDVEPSQENWLGYFLKIWSDHYPFIAERKGGSRQIRPKRIIVTSNYSIGEIFKDPKISGPLMRRFSMKTVEGGTLHNYVPSVPESMTLQWQGNKVAYSGP